MTNIEKQLCRGTLQDSRTNSMKKSCRGFQVAEFSDRIARLFNMSGAT